MTDDLGPPGGQDGSGPAPPGEPGHHDSATAKPPNTSQNSAPRRQCDSDAMRRRRQASYRLPPLDCGCRDPWPCRCDRPPLSQKIVDAGAQAAQHLRDCGLPPLVDVETRRALWRRGGDDRRLARELYGLCGGDA
jgi:hypothetical protein